MYDPNNAGQIRFQVDPHPAQAAPLGGHEPPSSSSEDSRDAPMDDSGEEEANDGFPVADDDAYEPLYQPKQTEREPNSTIRDQFLRYLAHAEHNYVNLPPEYAAGIELMSILDKEGAPLTAYDKIMEWHTCAEFGHSPEKSDTKRPNGSSQNQTQHDGPSSIQC